MSATPIRPSKSNCSYKTTSGTSTSDVLGASNSGATTLTIVCSKLPASTPIFVVQASPLAGAVSPQTATTERAEIDEGTAVLASSSAGGTMTTTITVTASGGSPAFSASDSNAVCPPTPAQVNAGLTNCEVAVTDLVSGQGLNVASIDYGTQPTPNSPTLAVNMGSGPPGTVLTASDATAACLTPPSSTSNCWWGDAVSGAPNPGMGVKGFTVKVGTAKAANTLAASPAVYCASGATAPSCAGQPTGTIVPPQLSGTITVPAVLPGSKTITVTEPNPGGIAPKASTPFTVT